jgi:hypothetical protein
MCIGDKACAFVDPRTAQDIAMASMTAMTISEMQENTSTQGGQHAGQSSARSFNKWQVLSAAILVCMLLYSSINAFSLMWASDSEGGFCSEYYRLLSPLRDFVSTEVQGKVCMMFALVHGGLALVTAFHFATPGYMCNYGEVGGPEQALRMMSVISPMIGRSIVTEVIGYVIYGMAKATCSSVYSASKSQDSSTEVPQVQLGQTPPASEAASAGSPMQHMKAWAWSCYTWLKAKLP